MKFSPLLSVGRICLLAIISGSLGAPAVAQGICYMVTPEGRTINLESLCRQDEPAGGEPNPVDSVNRPSVSDSESNRTVNQYIIIEDANGERTNTVVDVNPDDADTGSENDDTVVDVDANEVEVMPLSEDESAETSETEVDDADLNDSEATVDTAPEQTLDSSDEEQEPTIDVSEDDDTAVE